MCVLDHPALFLDDVVFDNSLLGIEIIRDIHSKRDYYRILKMRKAGLWKVCYFYWKKEALSDLGIQNSLFPLSPTRCSHFKYQNPD